MQLLRQKLQSWVRHKIWAWLERRQPPVSQLILRQNILYVLPSKYGISLFALAAILYLLGSNYQNNLILLLSFLLIGLLLLAIILAFKNLHGLVLQSGETTAAFAGDMLNVRLRLANQQGRQLLEFSLNGDRQLFWTLPSEVMLQVDSSRRGFYRLPRFKIQSLYPFGLIRCWCYPALNQSYWVYPNPLQQQMQQHLPTGDGELQWSHLSPYQMGDALQRIDWKRLSRQPSQPVVKVFSQHGSELHQLVVPTLSGAALEQSLSQICAQILHLSHRHLPYTLEVQGRLLTREQLTTAQNASGQSAPQPGLSSEELHRQRCLEALSLC